MIEGAREEVEAIEISPQDGQTNAKRHYIMGKILYAENRYMKAYQEFMAAKEMRGVSTKRKAKAWLKIGLVKTMASNHMQALQSAARAREFVDGKDKLLKFKWMLSKAGLLKKGSWYKQSYDLLKELEKEIDSHLETLQ